jgi:hypothetical protein
LNKCIQIWPPPIQNPTKSHYNHSYNAFWLNFCYPYWKFYMILSSIICFNIKIIWVPDKCFSIFYTFVHDINLINMFNSKKMWNLDQIDTVEESKRINKLSKHWNWNCRRIQEIKPLNSKTLKFKLYRNLRNYTTELRNPKIKL